MPVDLLVDFGTRFTHIVQVLESPDVRHLFSVYLSTNRYGPPNNNWQQPVTIPLEVQHVGGAEEDVDYTPRIPSSLTFAAGQSQASFSIRGIPDGKRETGEGLRLDFGPLPSGVRKGAWGPYETIEFVDQVLPKYTVLFGAEAYTATEGGASAQVSIHLNEPVEIEPVEVRLLLEYRGGASEADHNSSLPRVVTIPVGKQTATITVTATDDTADDDGESVTLSFVNDPNGRVRVGNGPSSATVALEDNDGAEQVTVSFGAATYTATEGGDDATVRVELDAAPGRAVEIPLEVTLLGTATAADYVAIPSSVTFGVEQTAATFTVTATVDQDADGDESVLIGFGRLPDGVVAGSPAAAAVTLADGTEQKLVVEFDTSRSHTVQVREGGVRKRLRVLLDTNTRRTLTIPLVVTHVGGATEADYAELPESVTIAAGESGAPYYVRALPDEEDETGEGLRLDFGELPPGVRKGRWGPYETIAFVDAGNAANLSVSGATLTVGYPNVLDETSTPSPRDFAVWAAAPGGATAMVAVTAVRVDGSDVVLQLRRPVTPDDTVTLSYLTAAMHPIRDSAGLPAPPLAAEPVRNDTGVSDPLPVAGRRAEAPGGAGIGRLDLSSRNLTDGTALTGLTGLRELDLSHNAIADLWPLAELTGLRVLNLAGNRIEDLRPLAGLTSLERLNLSDNAVADLWPLAELTGLRVLNLAGNRIEDLWQLGGVNGLRELGLSHNAIADLSPLAGLTGLRVLDLAGNRIEDLWPLAGVTALERLNLSDNRIADLWPLAGLMELNGLEVLRLDGNRVADVQALAPMTRLANLGLAGNPIADLWPLVGLGQLHRLDLSGSAVVDLSALGRLENLPWVWLGPETARRMEAWAPPAGRVPARAR